VPRALSRSEPVRLALGSLTRLERSLNRRLIYRQLDYGRKTEREIDKYGFDGAIKLYSARAMYLYEVVGVLVGVGAAVARQPVIAGCVFLAVLVLVVLIVIRLASGARSGRHWRRGRSNDQ
jgi:hypothetical protein